MHPSEGCLNMFTYTVGAGDGLLGTGSKNIFSKEKNEEERLSAEFLPQQGI